MLVSNAILSFSSHATLHGRYQHFNFDQNPCFFFFGPPPPCRLSLRFFSFSVSAGVLETEWACPCPLCCADDLAPVAPGKPPSAAICLASTTRRTITERNVSMFRKHAYLSTAVYSQANVSSIFTISLALVSIKPQPRCLAHSSPSLEVTLLASFRSHLFPATIVIGGGCSGTLLSAPDALLLAISSSRLSVSISIICMKWSSV